MTGETPTPGLKGRLAFAVFAFQGCPFFGFRLYECHRMVARNGRSEGDPGLGRHKACKMPLTEAYYRY